MKRLTYLILAIVFLSSLTTQAQQNILAYDVALISINSPGYAQPGDMFTITGVIKNNGTQRLNDVLINWQVNEGSVFSYKKDGMDLSKSITESFTHPDQIRVSDTTDFLLKVWVSQPNGQADQKARNDTLTKTIQVVVEFPERNVLIEEATGAWCGWCPRGPIVFRDEVHPRYPNTILVALHNGDDMVFEAGNTVIGQYISGFPSGMIDRRNPGELGFGISTNSWVQAISLMDIEFTPAELNVYNYYYPETAEWKIDIVADFIIDYEADLRLNCFIVEDSVVGSGSGYDQANYYNTMNTYPELEDIGNPIIGYPHRHVVREMLGGAWGAAGVIPKKVKKGERYIFSRTIKMSTRWRPENVHLVGVLQAYNSNANHRPILNAIEAPLSYATGYEQYAQQANLTIYPNPSSSTVTMDIKSTHQGEGQLEVFTLSGKRIQSFTIQMNGDSRRVILNCSRWPSGHYFTRFTAGNTCVHKKFIVSN